MNFSTRNIINNIIYHKSTGKDDDSFVGLKIKGNEIHFYYPEAYHFDTESKTLRNDIISILNTISIAKSRSNDKHELFTDRDNLAVFALDSYLWIIYDYIKNGYYVNKEKEYKLNQNGKINWKRTLDTNPIISKSGNVIYNNIVVETANNVDNIIVEIHKYCLKKSIDSIGWLFNLNSNFINIQPFADNKKNSYISILKKELSHTFNDEKKLRLKHFLNVLKGLNAKLDSKDLVYGVDQYYYVYERMIDKIFGNEDPSNFYPKGEWYIFKNGKYEKHDSSNLRPDTVLINKVNEQKNVYILDSKFYRYGVTGDIEDLPTTSSIQKQVAYGDFIKTNKGDEFANIYNAFLIPFDKEQGKFECNKDENIIYIGFSKTNISNKKNSHEFVHTFLIDLKHVIDTWNKLNHVEDVNILIEKIEESSNKIAKLLK